MYFFFLKTLPVISYHKLPNGLMLVVNMHCVKSVRISSLSGPNVGKYDPEKLRIRTLFTQRYGATGIHKKFAYVFPCQPVIFHLPKDNEIACKINKQCSALE